MVQRRAISSCRREANGRHKIEEEEKALARYQEGFEAGSFSMEDVA